MRTFIAALLGVLAAAAVVAAIIAPPAALRRATDEIAQRLRGDGQRQQAERVVQRREEHRRHLAAADELSEQRRERLASLTATLGSKPITPLTAAETRLFQDAARGTARTSGARLVHLVEPVQIDEWTTLLPGTAVEFVHYDRDNLITIRHDGAMYQVDPLQTDSRSTPARE